MSILKLSNSVINVKKCSKNKCHSKAANEKKKKEVFPIDQHERKDKIKRDWNHIRNLISSQKILHLRQIMVLQKILSANPEDHICLSFV